MEIGMNEKCETCMFYNGCFPLLRFITEYGYECKQSRKKQVRGSKESFIPSDEKIDI